ncbi:hypothetical protein B5K06_30835 [Rhizobium grahamii]|uniref:Uncharacterized protein n=1 Tax=Rhizobium grahamii TaxID=1120045 RepID=A0A370KF19_9HYPH|nr:hypothetical protein B5K06_30835 [Rhizobium grahamii]
MGGDNDQLVAQAVAHLARIKRHCSNYDRRRAAVIAAAELHVQEALQQLDGHEAGRLLLDRNMVRHRLSLGALLKQSISHKASR